MDPTLVNFKEELQKLLDKYDIALYPAYYPPDSSKKSERWIETARCAMADRSLRSKDAKVCLATVTEGEHANKIVGVMVQYTDGFCICDMGENDPMEIIHIDRLRLWIPVKSVNVGDDGRMTYEPI